MAELKNYCKCGCKTEIPAYNTWSIGHNVRARRSADAVVKNGRRYDEVPCDVCGQKHLKRSDHISRNGKANLCSPGCLAKYRSEIKSGTRLKVKKGKYKECEVCKKEYYVNPWRQKNSNSKFCSYKCKYEYQRLNFVIPKGLISSPVSRGKDHHSYKNGEHLGTSKRKKRKLKEELSERDGEDVCVICKEFRPDCHIHRVLPGSKGGKYVIDNCVRLCPAHHEEVHINEDGWRDFLLNHINEMGKFR